MRGHLVCICLLATTFALSVKSKPHNKHHAWSKSSHTAKHKDVLPEEADAEQLLPTFVSLEAGSGEQEDQELGANANANANANTQEEGVMQATQGGEKSTAVLLSEEELVDLLNKDTDGELEQEQDVEEEVKGGVDGQEVKADQDTENPQEEGEITENQEDAEEEKEREDHGQTMETYIKMLEEEEAKEDDEQEAKIHEEEEEIKAVIKAGAAVEGADGSTDSEILADLDYASDADLSQPLNTELQPLKEHLKSHNTQPLLKGEGSDNQASEEPNSVKLIPTIIMDEQDLKIVDALEREVMADQGQDELLGEQSVKEEEENKEDGNGPKLVEDQLLATPKSSRGVGDGGAMAKGNQAEGDKDSNNTGSVPKGKKGRSTRQRARKHAVQGDEAGRGPEPEAQGPNADSTDPKNKRRRTGKWAPLVGMNPVQIRSSAELYPSTKPASHQKENASDPCMDFRCKRGKACMLDADLKPACVCQEPTKCPASVNEFDHVCGTDNKTYDTACVLFATKCNLEGTKRGHKLHLDYTGPCKLLAPCLDSELVQFPLRMRDWLKNVLLQLYSHDSKSPGFLTSKQRIKVKKIHENERRLHAGDHPLDLLAQDFEKNYNLYIYPVHWQFAQMDKHPSDRLLSHSELAPLRVPLVPMEHCTSRFFQECDGDQDKQVSFREWAHCFGIKEEDMDVNLLF
ncbi:SPARC-like protein 1 isoform X2 [Gadus macrocephalus]|uniref:SPARC-like protein 1 isoform X2 n=1 Tax=Gadus macrocephalus TaxID=80720 RepID=UPI0028CBBC18|nr:SPARC-like protein 1 isoform X2 [Gadus macrocephalus]